VDTRKVILNQILGLRELGRNWQNVLRISLNNVSSVDLTFKIELVAEADLAMSKTGHLNDLICALKYTAPMET
jgi:hypothetical protein